MRRILTIIGLLFSVLLYSQNELDAEFQNSISDYKNFDIEKLSKKEFDNSLAKLLDSLPDHRKDRFYFIVERNLDFNVNERIYQIILNYAKEDGSLMQLNYKLHVLKKDCEIIGIICKTNFPSKVDTYFNETEIERYIYQHDSLYQTKTHRSNLIKDLVEDRVYGYSCGIAPVLQETPEQYGYKFNDIKQLSIFRGWLRSYSPELQTYGVDAIRTIYKQPLFLIGEKEQTKNEHDMLISKYIIKRNSTINTCSGCIFGIYSKAFVSSDPN
ncbi:MAG: hypothetical protein ACK5KT_05130 [Dysgonomonas sp.]